MAEVISHLQVITDDTGAAIWWSRHEGKGKAGAPLIERGRGSSAIPGEADCCFSISRVAGKGHANRRQVEYEGRFTAIPEARVMDFDDGAYSLLAEGSVTDTRAPEHQAALRFVRDYVPTAMDLSAADLLKIEDAPKKSLLHVASAKASRTTGSHRPARASATTRTATGATPRQRFVQTHKTLWTKPILFLPRCKTALSRT